MAVPTPSSTAPANHSAKFTGVRNSAIAIACSHMPPAIIHLRPTRSESAPVTSWQTPHVTG